MMIPKEKSHSLISKEQQSSASASKEAYRNHHAYPTQRYRTEALILAAGLIIAAGISSMGSIKNWLQQDNLLQEKDGAIRLGQVYSEKISCHLIVSRVVDNSTLLDIEAAPDQLYPLAVEKILYSIKQINDQARSRGEKFTPVELDSAMWGDDIRIRLTTSVTYHSEYHPQYRFVMDTTDRIIPKDKTHIKSMLDNLQNYGNEKFNLYHSSYSFIHSGI